MQPPPLPSRTIVTAGVLLAVGLQMAIILMGATRIYELLGIEKNWSAMLYLSRSLFWVSLALVWWYATTVEEQSLLLWEDRRYTKWQYLASVAAIFGTLIAIAIIAGMYFQLFKLQRESLALDKMIKLFSADRFLYLFTCITAGVVEELIFRGYLLPRLHQLFRNAFAAILVSSVLFGLLHVGYGTLINMIGPFLIGLAFAFYYWEFRNINVLIFCHITWDILAVGIKMLYPKLH